LISTRSTSAVSAFFFRAFAFLRYPRGPRLTRNCFTSQMWCGRRTRWSGSSTAYIITSTSRRSSSVSVLRLSLSSIKSLGLTVFHACTAVKEDDEGGQIRVCIDGKQRLTSIEQYVPLFNQNYATLLSQTLCVRRFMDNKFSCEYDSHYPST
jgi:hypothetical protein